MPKVMAAPPATMPNRRLDCGTNLMDGASEWLINHWRNTYEARHSGFCTHHAGGLFCRSAGREYACGSAVFSRRSARTGDPGWPVYDLDRRATRRFDTTVETLDDPEGGRRELWADIG
jgi:hypothetical protein